MAFVIEKSKEEDNDRIVSSNNKRRGLLHIQKETWEGEPLVRDEDRDAFLVWAGGGSQTSVFIYMFGWGDEIALIEMKGYCLFSFLYVDESLLPRLDEAKALIAEAFLVGGLFLQGNDNSFDENRVPHAEFDPYPSLGA